ncbi:TetR/AcrR family transcriptional regulator [Bacillus sp. AFS055030]|uniref:TetR/AcrR family transcriptional regulator n=1 Tax=Bacillus sp. AFS055030 TaxID=2033507 RepID=UPI000BFDA21A|nr:TetR/AcrR family transcriptional regulator [Bacillus sp. AFS055030]PGL71026.1 TetR family transcriptional regulator [Bacillus sp. AFS055030]
MNTQSMDPRAVRTRQLIIDAFNQLISTKNFDQISVKDITAVATINRATFYTHFVDKYVLLDVVLTERIKDIMKGQFNCNQELNEETVVQMFKSIVQIHENMHTHCRRGYNTFTQMIEEKVKEQLTLIVTHILQTENRLEAAMFAWALYSSFVEWEKTGQEPAEQFAKKATTSLLRIIDSPHHI